MKKLTMAFLDHDLNLRISQKQWAPSLWIISDPCSVPTDTYSVYTSTHTTQGTIH